MQFIWFNPDLNFYQKGSLEEYRQLTSLSVNADRFDVLYEFSDTPNKLIDKILDSLNLVREHAVTAG